MSDALSDLYRRAKRVAQLKVPVLLLGERGTGKTKMASWIRLHSPYRIEARDEAWPSVACGQYAGDTIKAELFGYKQGAFTDAREDRDGLLKIAHGDTLFLDEVGDITRDVQRLLIRAIEEHTFLPLGSDVAEQSDFRLVTATNRSPDELHDVLDPDFYDRISSFTLTVPPLRDMPGDIPWLWSKVYRESLRRSCREELAEIPRQLHERVVDHLQRHPLPGNLRDLFRVAYHLIEASIEVDEETPPLPPENAVEYALTHGLQRAAHAGNPTRAVAAAFAAGEPLNALLQSGPLHLDEIQGSFRRFLGTELLRIARQTGQPLADLCDKAERTLYEWKK